MTAGKHYPNAEATRAEAAEWFIRLQASDVSPADQEAYADWLRRSPVHVEEFLRLTALHGDLSALPEIRDADVTALLFALPPGRENVIELESPLRTTSVIANVATRASWLRWFAVAAILVLITVGALLTGSFAAFFGTEHYNTAVGEQRSLTLTDGSHVKLNVQSRLTARVDATTRDVRLDGGEALFQVAKDPLHPFHVYTPQATIEAKGTEFNVHVVHGQTVVALLEGHIEVRSPQSAPVLLEPGQELTIGNRSGGMAVPRRADLASVTAWTERRLILVDRPLYEVIEEFNLYSRQRLVIEDPSIRDMRISINFQTDTVQIFGASLAAASGLKVIQQTDGAWLIQR
jgi:transmembrane sensor